MSENKIFEYLLHPLDRDKNRHEIEDALNRVGQDGWELCATDYGCFIFKREIND